LGHVEKYVWTTKALVPMALTPTSIELFMNYKLFFIRWILSTKHKLGLSFYAFKSMFIYMFHLSINGPRCLHTTMTSYGRHNESFFCIF
jgi:hypothetical protein